MSMVSRKRSRLLIIWILTVVLVGSIGGALGSQAWAGEPDVISTMPTAGQLSLWALLHGILVGVGLPLP